MYKVLVKFTKENTAPIACVSTYKMIVVVLT